MNVYVDNTMIKFGRMKMCHMVADSEEDLHSMADKIGIDRRLFQNGSGGFPHYDLCNAKRKLAVKMGAIPVTLHKMGRVLRRLREKRNPECEICGTTNNVSFGPDPYVNEICHNDTEHWLCAECRQSLLDEI